MKKINYKFLYYKYLSRIRTLISNEVFLRENDTNWIILRDKVAASICGKNRKRWKEGKQRIFFFFLGNAIKKKMSY